MVMVVTLVIAAPRVYEELKDVEYKSAFLSVNEPVTLAAR
jgi:hypothetical protein